MIASRMQQRLTAALIVLAGYLSVTIRATSDAPCYYPGGEHALGFYPCQLGAFISSCCPAGWTCFSNALCIATTVSNSFPNLTLGAVQRGACTNPQWNNDICGGACLDSDNADGKLAACGDDRFCCANDFNSGKCNCSGGDGSKKALTITAGIVQTIIQVTDTTFVGAPSLSIASTRSSLPSTTSTHSSSSATGTNSGTATSGQTPSSTSLAPMSTTTGDAKNNDNGGSSSRGRTIGIAVGVSVGAALIAVILIYIFWWKPRHPPADAQPARPDAFEPSSELAEDHENGPTFGQRYHA